MFSMRIINKIIIEGIIFLGSCFLGISAYADSCPISMEGNSFCGAAGGEIGGQYMITIKKIELSTDGTNFITVGESNGTTFNIANMSAGSDFQSFVSNETIPAGTYNYLRITMSRTITFKGMGQNAGTYYYTSNATGTSPNPPYFPLAASCASWNVNQPGAGCDSYDAVSINIPDDAVTHHAPGETLEFVNGGQDVRIKRELASPIVITEGENGSLQIKFYTQGMIGFSGSGPYAIFPMPPIQELSY